jgi:hypothetical protein
MKRLFVLSCEGPATNVRTKSLAVDEEGLTGPTIDHIMLSKL